MLNVNFSEIHRKQAWRKRVCISKNDPVSIVYNGKTYIDLSSNDYLNLAQHTIVKHAFSKAAKKYGLGSGASPLVSGFSAAHQKLEEAFSDFLKRETLLFNSGFHANLAIFDALADRHSWIYSDKYCHASLLDGIRLSRAKHQRFPHQDLNRLKDLLQPNKHNIIVTESIFSMDGDLTPIKKFSDLARANNALLVVDDAHGLGVLGKLGAGVIDHVELSQESIHCLIQPLGKALGSMGAIISGDTSLIETLIQKGRTYRYSTALPPAVAEATMTALTCLQQESWRRIKLNENIMFFNQSASKFQIPLISMDNTPIRSVFLGSNHRALACQEFLRNQGYFVVCIRPPTVPENTARLRISLSSELSIEHIERLIVNLAEFFDQENK